MERDFESQWREIKVTGIDKLRGYLAGRITDVQVITQPDGSKRELIFTNDEYSDLYTRVYKLSTQRDNQAKLLYQGFKDTLVDFCEHDVNPCLQVAARANNELGMLDAMVTQWKKHQNFSLWMRNIFCYLDRFHINSAGSDPLEDCSLRVWISATYEPYEELTHRYLLNTLQMDRSISVTSDGPYQCYTDAKLLNEVTLLSCTVAQYDAASHSRFKDKVRAATTAFYSDMSTLWVNTISLADYLKNAEKSFQQEAARCDQWLKGSRGTTNDLEEDLQKIVGAELLIKPLETLLNLSTGISYMLENDNEEDLKRCYQLLRKCGCEHGVALTAKIFHGHVLEQGRQVVRQKASTMKASSKDSSASRMAYSSLVGIAEVADLEFVRSLIKLHLKYQDYTQRVFENDFEFANRLKDAFESCMRQDVGAYPMAAFLCTACDRLIRRPPNANIPATPEALEKECYNIVKIFCYLTDKDQFAEGYRQQMAKRLIGSKSTPSETEQYLVKTLKHECGNIFSNKMEGMLADMEQSAMNKAEYTEYFETNRGRLSEPDIQVTVQVLTTGHWPQYQNEPLEVPRCIQQFCDLYEEWYKLRTSYRKLTWYHTLSEAIVAANLPSAVYQVVCSGIQAVLLLAFSAEKQSLTFAELEKRSGLQGETLKKFAKSLYAKVQLITRGTDAESGEVILSVNKKFAHQARRFKLPVPVEQEKSGKDSVAEDRSQAIQAAIVRIMKSRKRLGHPQLISEVIQALNLFKPEIRDIKQTIEMLVNKEYMARDENDESTYIYTS